MDYKKYLQQNRDAALLVDKVKLANNTWRDVFTDFITPDLQDFLESICKAENMYVRFFGGKGNFERAVGVIGNVPYEGNFPVEVIRIIASSKFESLNHRDYLGALLSLGIKREKVGDINIYEDGAEVYVSSDISDYVCFNISKIKHTGVSLRKIDIGECRERKQDFKNISINISALRLDAIVSGITKISRSQAQDIIKKGDVKINYIIINNNSIKVHIDDLISVKGYGRFVISEIISVTKKERLIIIVKKYL